MATLKAGRVNAYRATDGVVLLDRKSWIRHESNLLAMPVLQAKLAQVAEDKYADDAEAKAAYLKRAEGVLKDLGMDTVRDAMAIVFRPSKDEDGEDTNAAGGATGGEAAATGGAAAATGGEVGATGGAAAGEGADI